MDIIVNRVNYKSIMGCFKMKTAELDKKMLKMILIGIISVFILIIAYEYYFKYMYIVRSPKKLKYIILSYGRYGIFVFLILQMLQVVAFFIPGELIQIASGYIYGTFLGTLLSIFGITLGSIIAYLISRILGKPLLVRMISKRKFEFFKNVLNFKNINLLVFFLYLIPGIPKDILAYICGISRINLKDFTIYSTLGRLPGIIISSYFGSKIYSGDKLMLIFISAAMILLFTIGFLKREKIMLKISKYKT